MPSGLVALALLLATPARAAEVTDMPPAMRGDVDLIYAGQFQQVGLEEQGLVYAIRNTSRHDFDLHAEFSPYPGLAITLGLPTTPSLAITYPAAREMLYEPVDASGSYEFGLPLAALPEWRGGGVQGFWIGAAFTPFSESFARSLPATMRLDIAVRTPAPKSTLYGEKRGAAPGGAALLLGLAVSVERARSAPYLSFQYQGEFGATIDVTDADGSTVATELPIKAASKVDGRIGGEIFLVKKPEKNLRVALDLYAGAGYRSWADTPSGFHLPSVLTISRDIPVTRGDYVLGKAGLSVIAHVNRWVNVTAGMEGRYLSPHTIEHVYAVKTDAQSFELAWTLGVTGKIRLKDD